ncbi:MAG TPA: hypothetical protein VJP77_05435, partial [Planctomycetota bacterium]|nr:hypothetical protein [Planctomycetota bacterium]
VALARVGFTTRYLPDADVPAHLLALAPGAVATHEGGVVQMTPERQLRLQQLGADLGAPFEVSTSGSAVVALDFAATPYGKAFAALTAAGELSLTTLEERPDFMTGATVVVPVTVDLPLELPAPADLPSAVLLSDYGDQVYVLWKDGRTQRFEFDLEGQVTLAEALDVLPEPELELTCVEYLLGGRTFVAGDSSGRLQAWFLARSLDAEGIEQGRRLVVGHSLPGQGAAVTAISSSPRSRLLAVGAADGRVVLRHLTSDKLVAEARADGGAAIEALLLTPKEDGVVGIAGGAVVKWDARPGHPEASLAALFRPAWYEGYPAPAHVWQSTGGSDDFEPKLGLMPLVFGTLKATFYSLLFGAPLALLAALFSSEFLSPRLRAPLKSLLELMASLPSVVLGFLAALVIAPFVQSVLPAVLAAFLTIPLTLLLGAYAWQLLPRNLAVRWSGWQRLACIALALPVGLLVATVVGPLMEALFFAGDVEGWLAGQRGGATGGWVLLLLPLAAVAVAFAQTRVVNP